MRWGAGKKRCSCAGLCILGINKPVLDCHAVSKADGDGAGKGRDKTFFSFFGERQDLLLPLRSESASYGAHAVRPVMKFAGLAASIIGPTC